MTNNQFRNAIRRLGWNQAEAAQHLRLSQGHVSHIMRGNRPVGDQTALILALLLLDENDADQPRLLGTLQGLGDLDACFSSVSAVS